MANRPANADPMSPDARVDYRALEPNRTTLGQWDLQHVTGPKAGQYFEPVLTIVKVEKYKPDPQLAKRVKSKGNELLLSLSGKHGVLPKKWICRPDTKKSIAKAVGSHVIQDWTGKRIQIYFDPTIKFGREVTGGIRARRAPGEAPLTEERLDNPVDEQALERIEEAVRMFGDDEEGMDATMQVRREKLERYES